MKTTKNYLWMMGLMLCAIMTLTSCELDPDESIGYDVRGHWFGDMDMWIDGEKARGSEIQFTPYGWGYEKGTGVEVDYYYRGSVTHYFDYQIRNGVIYMTFDTPELDCAIVDFRLTYTYFSGYIADYYSLLNQTYFSLRNYDRDWEKYGYGGYGYYTKEPTMDTDSITTRSANEQQPKCIRGVNLSKVKGEE